MATLLSPRPVSLYPKIDLKSPVLYAPLWRPDMVARGGRIENGTGVLTGHPLHLAVGANTVTVTVAGTLIVYMPEGGTVASGTMTVTGSPVTISAGIATTITTTGAIGNITVTPSNIIRSKDKNNHAMTITGATWTPPTGYSLDGTDDYISCPSSVGITGNSARTYLAWVKLDDYGADSRIIGYGIAAASQMLAFATATTTGNLGLFLYANDHSTSISVTTGVWHQVGFTLSGITSQLIIDGVVISTKTDHGAINTGSSDFIIGRGEPDDPANFWDGMIGEVLGYNRVLTPPEIQRICLSTKWRYSG